MTEDLTHPNGHEILGIIGPDATPPLNPADPTITDFLPKNRDHPDRFVLGGDSPTRAVVLLHVAFHDMTMEALIALAAGAWKAYTTREPTREQAELIAKCWATCYAKYQANRPRIVLPPGITLQ